MGIKTSPRYISSSINHKSSLWDPCAILEIVNPDRGYLTCVGYAPSQHRRCRNTIAGPIQRSVYLMLDDLANVPPDSRSVEPYLQQIAALSLCSRNHQNQVDSVVTKWLSKISLMKRPLRGVWSPHSEYEELDIHHARSKAGRGSNWQSWSAASHDSECKPRTSKSNCQAHGQDEENRQRREERRRFEQKLRETERAEEERKEREREAHAEQERQNEKSKRLAAQLKREELQKQAREKAEQERKAWDQAWEDYVKRWAVFKENTQGNSQESIPWPVRSGRRVDVTEANVKLFFQKAPPDANVPAALFEILSTENKKWHPDKISHLFGEEKPEDVDMIGRILIELRKMAQHERKRAEGNT